MKSQATVGCYFDPVSDDADEDGDDDNDNDQLMSRHLQLHAATSVQETLVASSVCLSSVVHSVARQTTVTDSQP